MDDKVTPISPQAALTAARDGAKQAAGLDIGPLDPDALAKALAEKAAPAPAPAPAVDTAATDGDTEGGEKAAAPRIAGPDEPLIKCLAHMARHYGNPQPAEALVAGLPIAEQGLSWETFERASDRAGLNIERINRKLRKFGAQELPAILIMKDGKAVVLTGIKKVGKKKATYWAEIVDPAQAPATGGAPVSPVERTFDELGRD